MIDVLIVVIPDKNIWKAEQIFSLKLHWNIFEVKRVNFLETKKYNRPQKGVKWIKTHLKEAL